MLLTRRKLKTFVTLARQTLEITPRETGPAVRFSERGDTFTIAATHNQRWIEYCERGEFQVACFALPWLDVVKAAKVKTREMAFLTEENSIRLEWTASGSRQSRDFEIDPKIGSPSFPAPRNMTVMEGELLTALREAGQRSM